MLKEYNNEGSKRKEKFMLALKHTSTWWHMKKGEMNEWYGRCCDRNCIDMERKMSKNDMEEQVKCACIKTLKETLTFKLKIASNTLINTLFKTLYVIILFFKNTTFI